MADSNSAVAVYDVPTEWSKRAPDSGRDNCTSKAGGLDVRCAGNSVSAATRAPAGLHQLRRSLLRIWPASRIRPGDFSPESAFLSFRKSIKARSAPDMCRCLG